MTRQQRQGKATKAERESDASRQPAWREQTPTHPRKRVKRKPVRLATSAGKPVGPARGESRVETRRLFALPSRETLSSALRIAALLLSAIAVTVGLIYLLRWPLLAVGRASTQIGGTDRIAKEAVYESSGIDGRNILLLRASDIAAQVKQMPGVTKAAVHVRLPNQVIIDVREHAPLVAWQGITETVWLAADGSPVPQAGVKPPLSLTDQSSGRLNREPALGKLVLEYLSAIYAVRPELSEFYYAAEPGLYYRTAEGWDVWLGESGPIADKLALVDAAAKDITQRGGRAKVIDVRQSESKALWW